VTHPRRARDLGTLGGGESLGYGINAGGQVTGTIITADNFAYRAFLWDGMSMLDLNDRIAPGSGWTLDQGLAINDAGQITGFGTIGDEKHPFLLMLVTVETVKGMGESCWASYDRPYVSAAGEWG
jgi:probable HAF family extracellular repeat protein